MRKLNNNKQIVRENIMLNEQEQLLVKPNMKAAIGDRVKKDITHLTWETCLDNESNTEFY